MSAKLNEIVAFLDEYLGVEKFADNGTNGLQLPGREDVKKIALGVSASRELFKQAAGRQAQLIVVHHGLFWESQERRIDGVLKERLKVLLARDISLAAYHLPLDAHPRAGNNAQIIASLGGRIDKPFGLYRGQHVGWTGKLSRAVSREHFIKKIEATIGTSGTAFLFGPRRIKTLAVLSGGGAYRIFEAIEAGVDAFITGEALEFVPSLAREAGLNYLAPGHYNTETFGIKALGKLLRDRFKVDTFFIDLPNSL